VQTSDLSSLNLSDEPIGDQTRQAVACLRGFAYQLYASALAWLSLGDGEQLFLEIAEDYAVATREALTGVQVKSGTGKATIRSSGVVSTIDAFVDLTALNPAKRVAVRYLSTAKIGLERATADRAENSPTLEYWRRAAAGADVTPLRKVLLSLPLKPDTLEFIRARTDDQLRTEMLQRLHWDCGQPSLENLDSDLEDALIEVASSLQLGADSSLVIKPAVLQRIMLAATDARGRCLRRADLLKLVQQTTSISVPRALALSLLGGAAGKLASARLLTPGSDTTSSLVHVRRVGLVNDLLCALKALGAVALSGSTGVGKTALARDAAAARADTWLSADFRGLDAAEAAERLRAVRSELLVQGGSVLLLDDLDCMDDPRVLAEVTALLGVLRRRDGGALITCGSEPAPTTLARLIGGATGHLKVPYFELGEVEELLRLSGGPAELAKLVWAAGSCGHPQLVQAVVFQLRAANWQPDDLEELFVSEQQGVGAEKAAARRRLISALDEPTRVLLYRLSLLSGRFDRQLALALGALPPPVAQPGEALDRLTGTWVESLDDSELRISPLVADAGAAVLPTEEQQAVHRRLAEHYLSKGSLSVADADLVLRHALRGGDARHVVGFASAVVTASFEMLPQLGRHTFLLRSLRTDQPPTTDSNAAAMLRLAQFLVVVASGSPAQVQSVWAALQSETVGENKRTGFEQVILAKSLLLSDLSKKLPHWFDLLVRFDQLAQGPGLLGVAARSVEDSAFEGPVSALLFLVQAGGLDRIGELKGAFDQLNDLAPEVRRRFLSCASGVGGYSFFINSVWLKAVKHEDFDPEAAARDFRAMAALAEQWGEQDLATRCHVAAAVMIDEYANAPQRALADLAGAERRLGANPVLSRARAKIWWRQNEHEAALREFSEIDWSGLEDLVERAHVAREAGVSAANLDRWAEAADWFELGRSDGIAAGHAIMRAMAIGLGADAAHARFQSGDGRGAIDGYSIVLRELRALDPGSSLQAAYVHRVVRHAILWLQMETGHREYAPENRPVLPPGACSNPDPSEQIRNLPLGNIDLAWYLLAQAEQALGLHPEVDNQLHEELAGGPATMLEISRAHRRLERAIADSDAQAFVERLPSYLGAMTTLAQRRSELMASSLSDPLRGLPPPIDPAGALPDQARAVVRDSLIAFGIAAVVCGQPAALASLADAFPKDWAGFEITAAMSGNGELQGPDAPLLNQLSEAASGRLANPAVALALTMRIIMFARGSDFRPLLEEPAARWVERTWAVIVDEQKFRLILPQIYAAVLKEELDRAEPSLDWAARFAIAAVPATGLNVGEGVREALLPGDD
jgi:hypothetical protein